MLYDENRNRIYYSAADYVFFTQICEIKKISSIKLFQNDRGGFFNALLSSPVTVVLVVK
jgi:hypothetical protein